MLHVHCVPAPLCYLFTNTLIFFLNSTTGHTTITRAWYILFWKDLGHLRYQCAHCKIISYACELHMSSKVGREVELKVIWTLQLNFVNCYSWPIMWNTLFIFVYREAWYCLSVALCYDKLVGAFLWWLWRQQQGNPWWLRYLTGYSRDNEVKPMLNNPFIMRNPFVPLSGNLTNRFWLWCVQLYTHIPPESPEGLLNQWSSCPDDTPPWNYEGALSAPLNQDPLDPQIRGRLS